MATNPLFIGVIIAILAMMGIGIVLSFEVKTEDNTPLLKGEYRDGKLDIEQDQKGPLEALQDGLNGIIENNFK